MEAIDNPTSFVSGAQRPPLFVSPATPPSWAIVEGALGGSGKGLGLLASHQPWLVGSGHFHLQVLAELLVDRPCPITRAVVRAGSRLGTQLPASGLGSLADAGQETARLWWQVEV